MGLLDILTGMKNGPRGQPQPPSGSGSGGMSPLTMALIALLAYKGYKHFGGSQPAGGGYRPPTGGGSDGGIGSGTPGGSGSGGGLADILGGLFGGGSKPPTGGLPDVLGGRSPGSVLNGGLDNLIRDLKNAGQGRTTDSWVGKGSNDPISPNDLAKALGSDTINALTAQTGMSRDELLKGMSEQLPDAVDKLTPDGRLPTDEEAEERWNDNENESENEGEREGEEERQRR
jgi:uncharacterized protein YidB (DUF937 family)